MVTDLAQSVKLRDQILEEKTKIFEEKTQSFEAKVKILEESNKDINDDLQYLKELSKLNVLRTCEEMAEYGVNR